MARAKPSLGHDEWEELNRVNSLVNKKIRYRPDTGDSWDISPKEGDCDDYAVTKLNRLYTRGWPREHLRLALCNVESSHLVLIVDTDEGAYVLDNRTRMIKPWNRTGYMWISIECPSEGTWREIL